MTIINHKLQYFGKYEFHATYYDPLLEKHLDES